MGLQRPFHHVSADGAGAARLSYHRSCHPLLLMPTHQGSTGPVQAEVNPKLHKPPTIREEASKGKRGKQIYPRHFPLPDSCGKSQTSLDSPRERMSYRETQTFHDQLTLHQEDSSLVLRNTSCSASHNTHVTQPGISFCPSTTPSCPVEGRTPVLLSGPM